MQPAVVPAWCIPVKCNQKHWALLHAKNPNHEKLWSNLISAWTKSKMSEEDEEHIAAVVHSAELGRIFLGVSDIKVGGNVDIKENLSKTSCVTLVRKTFLHVGQTCPGSQDDQKCDICAKNLPACWRE